MENIIKETTKKLQSKSITKEEADQILLKLFNRMKSDCKHEYVKRGGPAVFYLKCNKCGEKSI